MSVFTLETLHNLKLFYCSCEEYWSVHTCFFENLLSTYTLVNLYSIAGIVVWRVEVVVVGGGGVGWVEQDNLGLYLFCLLLKSVIGLSCIPDLTTRPVLLVLCIQFWCAYVFKSQMYEDFPQLVSDLQLGTNFQFAANLICKYRWNLQKTKS